MQHIIQHAQCAQKKATCEVYCLHPPSVAVDLLSAVNETYCNKKIIKKIELMSTTSFRTCPSSTRNHLRKKGAIFDIVEKEWVLHVLRLNLGGDGF